MTKDYQHYSEVFRRAASQQDLDDYNNAISGADVGRIHRHGARAEIDPLTGERKGSAAQRAARTLDWLLANDATYAQAHAAATQGVADTINQADAVLEQLIDARAKAKAALEDILDRSPTLPDGRKVFKDDNGTVRDINGNPIDDDLAATIEWQGNEPSYNSYIAQRDRVTQIDAHIDETRDIEAKLGGFQIELADQEDPAPQDRIAQITEHKDTFSDRLSEIQTSTELELGSGLI
ncbi:MAG: hypothetical protein ACRBCT_07770, partial [Alphaproteobacteria bacterium]